MTGEPEKKRSVKRNITSVRFDDETKEQMKNVLADNPLYSPSIVLRGAMLAIFRLNKAEREEVILAAAPRHSEL